MRVLEVFLVLLLGFASFSCADDLTDAMLAESQHLANGAVSNLAPATLMEGQTLPADDYLQSQSGLYAVTLQTNGNFVLYSGGLSIWSSGTPGRDGDFYRLVMQPTGTLSHTHGLGSSLCLAWSLTLSAIFTAGNLVLYASGNSVSWSSGTAGKSSGPYQLLLQDDGNLVIQDGRGSPIWQTNTAGKGALVASIAAQVDSQRGTVHVDAVNSLLDSWHLPGQGDYDASIYAQFQAAAFAAQSQFQVVTFNIKLNPDKYMGKVVKGKSVTYDEWLGASHMIGDQLTMVYMHIVSTGTPIQQFVTTVSHNCQKCKLFATCTFWLFAFSQVAVASLQPLLIAPHVFWRRLFHRRHQHQARLFAKRSGHHHVSDAPCSVFPGGCSPGRPSLTRSWRVIPFLVFFLSFPFLYYYFIYIFPPLFIAFYFVSVCSTFSIERAPVHLASFF